MNFYYTPKVAGIVADWVNYISPVPAAQQYIVDVIKDPTVAESPLVFPTQAEYAKTHQYYMYKGYNDCTSGTTPSTRSSSRRVTTLG